MQEKELQRTLDEVSGREQCLLKQLSELQQFKAGIDETLPQFPHVPKASLLSPLAHSFLLFRVQACTMPPSAIVSKLGRSLIHGRKQHRQFDGKI